MVAAAAKRHPGVRVRVTPAFGIESELATEVEEDALAVLVPESKLGVAQDAIESATEPDEFVGEP